MCDISILASSTMHATVQTLHYAHKLSRKLKLEEATLRFQYLGKDSSLTHQLSLKHPRHIIKRATVQEHRLSCQKIS